MTKDRAMLLAARARGQVSCKRMRSRNEARDPHLNTTAPRGGNEHILLIQTLTPAAQCPLLQLTRRVADSGCSLGDARVSTLGADVSVALMAQGSWDAVAKLETALTRMGRDPDLHLVTYRSAPRQPQQHLLPYLVEVVAADRQGVLAEVLEFFAERQISIEQLSSQRYQAMQTGAEMFSAQVTLGIPAELHIAALRDEFLELCDGLNLDAVMEPVKY